MAQQNLVKIFSVLVLAHSCRAFYVTQLHRAAHTLGSKTLGFQKRNFACSDVSLSIRNKCTKLYSQEGISDSSEGLDLMTMQKEINRMNIWKQIFELQEEQEEAKQQGDEDKVQKLSKSIDNLMMEDPYMAIKPAFDKAIASERFAEAARLQTKMLQAGMPPHMRSTQTLPMFPEEEGQQDAQLSTHMSALSTRSVSQGEGVKVEVSSFFSPKQSDPDNNYYFFQYHVSITNQGEETVQLVSRHWTITPVDGPTEEVRGPGVVGQQPVLEPGESFEYTSACPLRTAIVDGTDRVVGKMGGKYNFVFGDDGEKSFSLKISDWYFILPEVDPFELVQ